MRRIFQSDDSAAARPILQHEGLPEYLRQPVRRQAHKQVADSAGPVGYDDPDRPRRPVLCPLLRRCSEWRECEQQREGERAMAR